MKNLLFLTFTFVCLSTSAQLPVPGGLVAYYPFTGNVQDVSGNGLHGQVVNATLTTDRFNRSNGAYHFLAVDTQYIFVPSDTLLNFSYNMTLAFWVYKESYGGPDSSNTVMSVIHKGRDIHNSYGFYTVNFTDRFYVRNFGTTGANTDVTSGLTLKNWHFVTGVLDSSANHLYFYIDGVLLQTRTAISFESTNQYPLTIGRHFKNIDGSGGYGYPFDGKIDDIRLYDRALSTSEIQQLYQEQCQGFSSVMASDTMLCRSDTAILSISGGDYFSITPAAQVMNDSLLSPNSTTQYSVIVSKYNGCADTHSVTLYVSKPPAGDLLTASKDTICKNEAVTLYFAPGYSAYQLIPATIGMPDSSVTWTLHTSTTFILYVVDSFSCSYADTLTVFVEECLGIPDHHRIDEITVHPNPGYGKFQLQWNDRPPTTIRVRAHDLTGRRVYETSWSQDLLLDIDIRHLEDGIYLLELFDGEHKTVKKIVKM